MHKVFNPDDGEKAEICEGCKSAGIGCIDCKKKLNAHLQDMMAPVRERRAKYEGKKALLDEILADGAERAGRTARETMSVVYPAMGLLMNPKK